MEQVLDYIQFVLASQMLNGLAIGAAVIMMALGLTIIFGLLDVINMAHGEFYAVGGFVLMVLLGFGVNFWVCIALVPVLIMPIGYLIERTLIQPIFHKGDRHILTLLLTFGISIILQDLLKIIFGPNPLRPENPLPGGSEIFGIFLPNYRLFLIAVGGAIVAAVWMLVYKTNLGAMIRAAAFDKDMAGSLGVPVRRIYAGTFAFGIALAGLSGVLLAPIYTVFPTMGHDFILMAFTVVIVGGLGSITGAVLAGILLTQIQAISSLYISPVWSEPLIFTIMVAVLVVKPQGLFGKFGNG
jgi:branched-chain amino acid transport system permease protein